MAEVRRVCDVCRREVTGTFPPLAIKHGLKPDHRGLVRMCLKCYTEHLQEQSRVVTKGGDR